MREDKEKMAVSWHPFHVTWDETLAFFVQPLYFFETSHLMVFAVGFRNWLQVNCKYGLRIFTLHAVKERNVCYAEISFEQ